MVWPPLALSAHTMLSLFVQVLELLQLRLLIRILVYDSGTRDSSSSSRANEESPPGNSQHSIITIPALRFSCLSIPSFLMSAQSMPTDVVCAMLLMHIEAISSGIAHTTATHVSIL